MALNVEMHRYTGETIQRIQSVENGPVPHVGREGPLETEPYDQGISLPKDHEKRVAFPSRWNGAFEVINELKASAWTRVLLCRRLADGQDVVVRCSPDPETQGRISIDVLRDLAQGCGSLVQQFETIRDEKNSSQAVVWQVLEYCSGGTSNEHMDFATCQRAFQAGERIPTPDCLQQFVEDMSEALRHLHTRRIIHGDIKPQNILIRKNGTFVLGDLPTCILLDSPNRARRKRGESFPGGVTDGFIPASHEDFSPEWDYFQLGLTILSLVTGRHDPDEFYPEAPYERMDERLSLLLAGLLTSIPENNTRNLRRWGRAELSAWLENRPVYLHGDDIRDEARKLSRSRFRMMLRQAEYRSPEELAAAMLEDWDGSRKAVQQQAGNSLRWLNSLASQLGNIRGRRDARAIREYEKTLTKALKSSQQASLSVTIDETIAGIAVVLDPHGTPRYSADDSPSQSLMQGELDKLAYEAYNRTLQQQEDHPLVNLLDRLLEGGVLEAFSGMEGYRYLRDYLHGYRVAMRLYRKNLMEASRLRKMEIEQNLRKVSEAEGGSSQKHYETAIARRPPEHWEEFAQGAEGEAVRRHRLLAQAMLFLAVASGYSANLQAEAEKATQVAPDQRWFHYLISQMD